MNDLNFEGLSDKQLRLFAVRCARRVQHLMTDPRSIAALDVADRYATGKATDDELSAARAAAGAASAASWAAKDAAWAAASAASWAAARDAASSALWAVASSAASAVERVAAEVVEVAEDAERAEQQKILDEIRQEQPR